MSFSNFLVKNIGRNIIPAILPENLLKQCVALENVGGITKLVTSQISYELSQDSRIFVVGFGKGALRLAHGLNDILLDYSISGAVICVPEGSCPGSTELPPVYKVIKAAPSNIPDANSTKAGKLIFKLITKLSSNDLLFVLITGGGSALVTLPIPQVSSEDMTIVVKALHTAGATIEDLNAVREQLDILKAGGLSTLAYPAKVISFILSDVIGSNIDVIASGPTSSKKLKVSPKNAVDILKRYKIWNTMPNNVCKVLTGKAGDSVRWNYIVKHSRFRKDFKESQFGSHVYNVLIGSNHDAVVATGKQLETLGIPYVAFEKPFSGQAKSLGIEFAELGHRIVSVLYEIVTKKEVNYSKAPEFEKLLISSAREIKHPEKEQKYYAVAAVAGGETTVVVKGTGMGGRNQEAALSSAIRLNELFSESISVKHSQVELNLLFFSTDGQDGPTTANGAIATPEVVPLAVNSQLDPLSALENNDSFNFFDKLENGTFLISTGHTGTNVADVAVILMAVPVE